MAPPKNINSDYYCKHGLKLCLIKTIGNVRFQPGKFYTKRYKNEVNYIETRRIITANLFPRSDQENCSAPRLANY